MLTLPLDILPVWHYFLSRHTVAVATVNVLILIWQTRALVINSLQNQLRQKPGRRRSTTGTLDGTRDEGRPERRTTPPSYPLPAWSCPRAPNSAKCQIGPRHFVLMQVQTQEGTLFPMFLCSVHCPSTPPLHTHAAAPSAEACASCQPRSGGDLTAYSEKKTFLKLFDEILSILESLSTCFVRLIDRGTVGGTARLDVDAA